ncbi:flavodoxin [Streptomyces spiroverticillatus]|nr:flavodoxin domain-containing protein [Streptomyces finlayi]
MDVLVGHASAHGSTREIAERIGARLAEHGLTVEVRALTDVQVPLEQRAFVLGSAVHGQAWLPPAKDFVRRHGDLLRSRPVWLFSVGMPGALRGPWKRLADKEEPLILQDLPVRLRPREHRLLSGVVRPEHFPFTGRLMFRLMGCRYGDYRDWAAVEAWADAIARELAPVPPGPTAGNGGRTAHRKGEEAPAAPRDHPPA